MSAQNTQDMIESLCIWLNADYDENDLTQSLKFIKRRVYKDTDCGAWLEIDWDEPSCRVGAIVEGTDAEIEADKLIWPFTKEQLNAALKYVEERADEIWVENVKFQNE